MHTVLVGTMSSATFWSLSKFVLPHDYSWRVSVVYGLRLWNNLLNVFFFFCPHCVSFPCFVSHQTWVLFVESSPNQNCALEIWDVFPIRNRGLFSRAVNLLLIIGTILARGLDSKNRAQRGPYKKNRGLIFSQKDTNNIVPRVSHVTAPSLGRARRDPGWVWSRVSQNLRDNN